MGKDGRTTCFHPFLAFSQKVFRAVKRMFCGRTEMTTPIITFSALKKNLFENGYYFVLADYCQAENVGERSYELALRFFKVTSTDKDSEGHSQWVFVFWMDGYSPDVASEQYMHNLKFKASVLVAHKMLLNVGKGDNGKPSVRVQVMDKELTDEQVILS